MINNHMTTIRHSMAEICCEISDRTGIPVLHIYSKKKDMQTAWARAAVFYYCREQGFSYPQIAKAFGLHHTSAIYGVKAHEQRVAKGKVDEFGNVIRAHGTDAQVRAEGQA